MKILFLTTAHNSLSQRLSLLLTSTPHNHHVTVELALSAECMIEAVQMAKPDLIICPFLTRRVPKEIYENNVTLIVHPGPPGDSGPSSLDWFLLGDDGSEQDATTALRVITSTPSSELPSTRYWGVTVLQAEEELDAGPVYAFSLFKVPLGISKSDLYRQQVTFAAQHAVLAAIELIKNGQKPTEENRIYSVPDGRKFCGKTRERPLLKASDRDFDPTKESADIISRKLLSANSQPGVLSRCLASYLDNQPSLFLYGGELSIVLPPGNHAPGTIISQRDSAILLMCADGRAVWITHVREPKNKSQTMLNPKLPAVVGLKFKVQPMVWEYTFGSGEGRREIRVEWEETTAAALSRSEGPRGDVRPDGLPTDDYSSEEKCSIAYIHFDCINGAMSTASSQQLLKALHYAVEPSSAPSGHPLRALVMMGGEQFFSNGIHLSVIEGSQDPATESWEQINAIDDVCEFLLSMNLPARKIVTVAAVRANAAAGGFALATCCDIVIASEQATLNPHYRGVGLFGSEFHTYTWRKRLEKIGDAENNYNEITKGLLPMSSVQAKALGLVDEVIPYSSSEANQHISKMVKTVLSRRVESRVFGSISPWCLPLSTNLASGAPLLPALLENKLRTFGTLSIPLSEVRQAELNQMLLDFYHPYRSRRYHSRRTAFARKIAPKSSPHRFALHRRFSDWTGIKKDVEETESFDSLASVEETRSRTTTPPSSELEAPSLTCSPSSTVATSFSSYPAEFGAPKYHEIDAMSRNSSIAAWACLEEKPVMPLFPCLYEVLECGLAR